MVEPVIVEHHKLEKILAQQFTEESSFEFSDEEFDLDVDLEAPSSQEDEEERLKAMKHLLLNILINYSSMQFVWGFRLTF